MICSWLTDAEFKLYETVSDKYLNELLQEVRALSNNKYCMQERAGELKGWFGKRTKYAFYILYYSLGGGQVQQINFCQDHEWSINPWVSKSYMVILLLGILAGSDLQRNKK